jgi:TPR repeat protein
VGQYQEKNMGDYNFNDSSTFLTKLCETYGLTPVTKEDLKSDEKFVKKVKEIYKKIKKCAEESTESSSKLGISGSLSEIHQDNINQTGKILESLQAKVNEAAIKSFADHFTPPAPPTKVDSQIENTQIPNYSEKAKKLIKKYKEGEIDQEELKKGSDDLLTPLLDKGIGEEGEAESLFWYRELYSISYGIGEADSCNPRFMGPMEDYQKAADKGHAESDFRYAEMLLLLNENDKNQVNIEEALKYLEKGASKGSANCQALFGCLLHDETLKETTKYLTRALEHGAISAVSELQDLKEAPLSDGTKFADLFSEKTNRLLDQDGHRDSVWPNTVTNEIENPALTSAAQGKGKISEGRDALKNLESSFGNFNKSPSPESLKNILKCIKVYLKSTEKKENPIEKFFPGWKVKEIIPSELLEILNSTPYPEKENNPESLFYLSEIDYELGVGLVAFDERDNNPFVKKRMNRYKKAADNGHAKSCFAYANMQFLFYKTNYDSSDDEENEDQAENLKKCNDYRERAIEYSKKGLDEDPDCMLLYSTLTLERDTEKAFRNLEKASSQMDSLEGNLKTKVELLLNFFR